MAYIGKSPSTGIRNRFIYTATAGQATFSGTDDHNRTLSYTDAEFTDVFLNGVKLDKSDYTATSGTSIVLDEAAAAGDTLEVLNFDTFSVFSGEFSQDVTVGGATTLSGDLTVDTNTLKVDSTNNRVGIGTASPASKVHIQTASSGATVGGGGDELIVENSLTAGLSILSGASNDGNILFGDSGNSAAGYVQYKHGDDALAFGTVATERMRIDSSGQVGIGTTSPSYHIHSEKSSTSSVDILHKNTGTGASANTRIMSFVSGASGGDPSIGVGVSGVQDYFWRIDNDDSDKLKLDSNGTTRMTIDSSGRLGIGTTSPAAELHINDASGLSAIRLTGGASGVDNFQIMQGVTGVTNSGLSIYDIDATATRMAISSTGDVTITGDSNAGYVSVPQAYTGTTSGAANLHILSNGAFLRSTSSGRYKTGIEDAEMSYAEELYNLRPVYYKSLGTFDNPDHSHWGFIAEEVAEIDPRLCLFKTTEPELDDEGNIQYDDDGNIVEATLEEPLVEGVQYDRMIPLLLMLLKAEKDKVETLETKVATLETQNADFEARLTALEAN